MNLCIKCVLLFRVSKNWSAVKGVIAVATVWNKPSYRNTLCLSNQRNFYYLLAVICQHLRQHWRLFSTIHNLPGEYVGSHKQKAFWSKGQVSGKNKTMEDSLLIKTHLLNKIIICTVSAGILDKTMYFCSLKFVHVYCSTTTTLFLSATHWTRSSQVNHNTLYVQKSCS